MSGHTWHVATYNVGLQTKQWDLATGTRHNQVAALLNDLKTLSATPGPGILLLQELGRHDTPPEGLDGLQAYLQDGLGLRARVHLRGAYGLVVWGDGVTADALLTDLFTDNHVTSAMRLFEDKAWWRKVMVATVSGPAQPRAGGSHTKLTWHVVNCHTVAGVHTRVEIHNGQPKEVSHAANWTIKKQALVNCERLAARSHEAAVAQAGASCDGLHKVLLGGDWNLPFGSAPTAMPERLHFYHVVTGPINSDYLLIGRAGFGAPPNSWATKVGRHFGSRSSDAHNVVGATLAVAAWTGLAGAISEVVEPALSSPFEHPSQQLPPALVAKCEALVRGTASTSSAGDVAAVAAPALAVDVVTVDSSSDEAASHVTPRMALLAATSPGPSQGAASPAHARAAALATNPLLSRAADVAARPAPSQATDVVGGSLSPLCSPATAAIPSNSLAGDVVRQADRAASPDHARAVAVAANPVPSQVQDVPAPPRDVAAAAGDVATGRCTYQLPLPSSVDMAASLGPFQHATACPAHTRAGAVAANPAPSRVDMAASPGPSEAQDEVAPVPGLSDEGGGILSCASVNERARALASATPRCLKKRRCKHRVVGTRCGHSADSCRTQCGH